MPASLPFKKSHSHAHEPEVINLPRIYFRAVLAFTANCLIGWVKSQLSSRLRDISMRPSAKTTVLPSQKPHPRITSVIELARAAGPRALRLQPHRRDTGAHTMPLMGANQGREQVPGIRRNVVEFSSKLRRQDSNLNSQNQNLMCCRLHHDGPRISGERVSSPSACQRWPAAHTDAFVRL
jgi:hypothetical protein